MEVLPYTIDGVEEANRGGAEHTEGAVLGRGRGVGTSNHGREVRACKESDREKATSEADRAPVLEETWGLHMKPFRAVRDGCTAIVLFALPAPLRGCGGSSGVCENSGASPYELCSENIDEAHCNLLSPAKWLPGQTCADLGYTVPCPSENAGCFCHPGDPYCP
jgi:hypothetical protein